MADEELAMKRLLPHLSETIKGQAITTGYMDLLAERS